MWPFYKMSQVAEINPRDSHWKKLPDDTMVSFVPMPAVSEITASIEDAEIRPLGEVRRGYTHFRDNDVLFAKITPCMENGKVALAQHLKSGLGFGSTEFHVIRSKDGVLPRYLYFFVRQPSFRRHAKQRMRGAAGQQRVPKQFLADYQIPLPPLSEQRRIVELLDRADALRRMRRDADALAERVLPALFYQMFGDPRSNPKGIKKKPLKKLLRVKSGSFLPARSMDSEGPYPVYGGNGINGYHSEYLFEEPVIVIGRVGAYCGVVHRAPPRSWVTDNALYVSEMSDELNERYLELALRLANLNQYSSKAAQPLISGKRIYPVEILVPDLDAQETFVNRVAALDKLNAQAAKSRKALDDLFTLMLQRAFSGELTAAWREAHLKELLQEMEAQARHLGLPQSTQPA